MPNNFLHRVGLAVLILALGVAKSDSSPAISVSAQEGVAARSPVELPNSSLADQVLNHETAFCAKPPEKGLLLALTRWGSTTLSVFHPSPKELRPLIKRSTGELQVSLGLDRVAYLVREGVNPGKNYVEILDLKRGKCQLLKPANGFAILGFALAPSGEQLAYAAMNLRESSSTRLSWRAGLADLNGYKTRISAASGEEGKPGDGIPVPFAWSKRTAEIYLRGLLPFRGMVHQGIFAMRPDGSALRRILPEPSYTAIPRLSPGGDYLAYLATRIESLPKGYTTMPGAPPGNVLAVLNLVTGEQSIWAQEAEGVFGAFAWSADGREILVSRQQWVEGRFRDVALLRVGRESSSQLKKIVLSPSSRVHQIGACRAIPIFWVEEGGVEARLSGEGETYLAFPDGKIQIIGCLGE